MKSNRIMQSKIYRFLDYVLRLILLNALIVIPSFSFFIIYASLNKTTDNPLIYLSLIPLVLWMFPSIVATSSVIRQYETNDTNTIFKDFFKSLKSTYLKSLLFTFVILVCGMLLYNSVMFFANYIRNSLIHTVGLLLSVSCIAIFIIIVINIILVMSYFKGLRVIEIVKLANIMAFKDLLSNILAMFVVLIFLFLDIAMYVLMAFGGFAIPIYLVIKLTFKKYIKIYRKVEEN